MTRAELIAVLAAEQSHLSDKDVELAVRCLLEQMSHAFACGERMEIRGFGSFSLRYRPVRIGRNPRTGESIGVSARYALHFKPGKALRDRVNEGYQAQLAESVPTSVAAGT